MSPQQDPLSLSSTSISSVVSVMPRSTSLSAGIPFARKRLQQDQTSTLLAVFQHRTHPSKEERALLSAQLGMEMKAVSAWFQNKRRGLKKKNLAWRRASLPIIRSENLPSHSRQGAGLSLDCIASLRERRTAPHIPSVPGDPLRPPLASRLNMARSVKLADKPDADLWEHIPSSPPAPPSSPAAESVRLSVLPARSRTMRSLEWACAKARAGGNVQEDMDMDMDCDVPPLILDVAPRDTEMDEDTDVEDFEAITPDASAAQIQLTPSPSPVHTSKKKKKGSAPPEADMEAAMALLGFMGRSA
ncbi:hypothetical protein B0H21DRAFT_749054 [Amylocystis lapponica]|nr:hypothetical protein B0H21DRAFT_749054 [Amylocystis lapponica]